VIFCEVDGVLIEHAGYEERIGKPRLPQILLETPEE
jgi:hypothetical protein